MVDYEHIERQLSGQCPACKQEGVCLMGCIYGFIRSFKKDAKAMIDVLSACAEIMFFKDHNVLVMRIHKGNTVPAEYFYSEWYATETAYREFQKVIFGHECSKKIIFTYMETTPDEYTRIRELKLS